MTLLMVVIITGCGGERAWSTEELRAIDALRDIAQAQASFQEGCYLDTDYDGIGDYGTLGMLADPDGHRGVRPLMNPLYTTERVGRYKLNLYLVPGEGVDSPPRWEGQAFADDEDLRCFFVDATGVVRFGEQRATANGDSRPVDEMTADA